jgi:hypothetical protein
MHYGNWLRLVQRGAVGLTRPDYKLRQEKPGAIRAAQKNAIGPCVDAPLFDFKIAAELVTSPERRCQRTPREMQDALSKPRATAVCPQVAA